MAVAIARIVLLLHNTLYKISQRLAQIWQVLLFGIGKHVDEEQHYRWQERFSTPGGDIHRSSSFLKDRGCGGDMRLGRGFSGVDVGVCMRDAHKQARQGN